MSPAAAIEVLVSWLAAWTLTTLHRREPDPPLRYWAAGFVLHSLTTLGAAHHASGTEIAWATMLAAIAAVFAAGAIVWGTLVHLGRARVRPLLVVVGLLVAFSVVGYAFALSFEARAIPIVLALGGSMIFVGVCLLRQWGQSTGSRIAGLGLTAYGLHIFDYPLFAKYPALLPWGHAFAVFLLVMISSGFVMLYFERARGRAAEREAQYRALFDNAVVGMFVADGDGTVVAANATLESLVADGRPLRGRALATLFADPASALSLLSIDPPASHEAQWVADDGRALHVHIHARRVPRAAGREMLEGVVLDVTRIEDLQRHLDRVQRAEVLGHVAGGIAHDLNNVLTVVLANVDLLKRAVGSDPRVVKLLASIRDASRQGAGLTRQLLTFARSHPATTEVFELGPRVERAAHMLLPSLGDDIVLALDAAAEDCGVRADPTLVEQIVVNLVLNARDALPSGGRVNVAVRRSADRVLLEVHDTGAGMDPATLRRAFEPFFSTKPQRTGLGLAVVQRVVKQSGAELDVDSTPGVGTTFRIWFPHQARATRAPEPGPVPIDPIRAAPVLVVEDRTDVRTAMASALEAAGFSVIAPATPGEAVDLVERGLEIAAMVTDVRMPELSGPEVARALWRVRPRVPVVFVSGYVEESGLTEVLEAPSTRFLSKPFAPETLVATVCELISTPGPPVVTPGAPRSERDVAT